MSSLTRTLNNGGAIPWIAFGTGTAVYKQNAEGPVTLAIKTGFTHLDGAQMYENEDTLGKAISKYPRSSLFVTTKLNTLSPGESVRESLQKSLERLGTPYVDLWLIHSATPHQGKLKEIWKEFEALQREGLAKHIGVSNFGIKQLEDVIEGASVVPQVNQIEYHPSLAKQLQPLLEFHKKYGIVTESYAGLADLVDKPGGPLDPVIRSVREALEKRRGSPVSETQVILKWLQTKEIVIVTTSNKEARLKEYLDTASVPILTPEEVHAIDEAGSKQHYRKFAAMVTDDQLP